MQDDLKAVNASFSTLYVRLYPVKILFSYNLICLQYHKFDGLAFDSKPSHSGVITINPILRFYGTPHRQLYNEDAYLVDRRWEPRTTGIKLVRRR